MVTEKITGHVDLLIERYPSLESVRQDVIAAYEIMEKSYADGNKLLVVGNGGSAADSEHIVGELMKGFKLPRKPKADFAEKLKAVDSELGTVLAENLQGALPAVALDGHIALTTAYMNDCEPLLCFAQQINGLGRQGDVFLGISTSGNAENVRLAAVAAKARGAFVAALTGKGGGKLAGVCDVLAAVPETETYKVQELHLPVYHALCLYVENGLFEE